MNLNELRLVVDEREKKSRIPDLLKAVGINVEVKTLPRFILLEKLLKNLLISLAVEGGKFQAQ